MSEANLFERNWRGDHGHFEMSITRELLGTTRFFGKGTMEGTKAFIAALDEGRDAVANAGKLKALIDLSDLDGVPIRAQVMLAKWLKNNKDRLESIAVFGGKAWEMKFARAVVKIARFHNVGFFDTEAEATNFLEK